MRSPSAEAALPRPRALQLSRPGPAAQLLAPDASPFKDLADASKTLKALKITHGALLFLRYTVEREVKPCAAAIRGPAFGALPPTSSPEAAAAGAARPLATPLPSLPSTPKALRPTCASSPLIPLPSQARR